MKLQGFDAALERHRRRLEGAFGEASELFHRKLDETIASPIWPWPWGESPRDIVDSTNLRQHQAYTPLGNLRSSFTNGAEYALAVHEGAVFRSGKSYPARPWFRVARREFDWPGTIAALYGASS